MKPIGKFFGPKKFKNQAASQASYELQDSEGRIVLDKKLPFKDMLRGLETFSHIWVIFGFHQNAGWKSVVEPPRGPKRGVFATRSPYRPNPIGMSAVVLKAIEGHELVVGAHDILNESPIYDIKPYLRDSDCIPESNRGWLEDLNLFEISISELAINQIAWLHSKEVLAIEDFILQKLSHEPLNKQKKRLKEKTENSAILCYRTWRIYFHLEESKRNVFVERIGSGYTTKELKEVQDPHNDKDLHRSYLKAWKTATPGI